MKRQKILFLITKGTWGGAQQYVHTIATKLPRKQFEAVVVFGEGGQLEQKLHDYNTRAMRLSGLQQSINPIKEVIAFLNLFSLLRSERPNILHVNSSKAGLLGVFAARLLGIHSVFTAHGWAFNEERSRIQRAGFWVLHWLTVLLSHKTIAVSSATREQMTILPFTKHKIAIIKNGTHAPHFKSQSEARKMLCQQSALLKKRIDSSDVLNWVGTLSELHPTKGLDYAIEAMALLKSKYKNVIFVIVGGGRIRGLLERHIRELGLENMVFLLGFVEDAPKYLKAFNIFTLTSISEALAYAVLEAGTAGLPVIATKVGGIPEIVTHKRSGLLVPVRNPKSIADAIGSLIENPQKAAALGATLKKVVNSDFSEERMIAETLQLYQSIR